MSTKRERARFIFMLDMRREAAILRDELVRRKASPATKDAARKLVAALTDEYRRARGWVK